MSSGRRSRRRSYELDLVTGSGLFDPEWYLRTYPDIAAAKIDPLRHYMEMGWRERRDPGPEFSGSSYLKANPDVEGADVNPLLHFLEYGYFEGRASSVNGRVAAHQAKKISHKFGPAAPCISIPLPASRAVRWERSYRLNRTRADIVSADGYLVGYCHDQAVRTRVQSCFSILKRLSGLGERSAAAWRTEPLHGSARLLDGWYVNASQLRTRWESDHFPFVVRAYQHDPLKAGALVLVAEGLVESPLDTLDLHLRNPLFPALFVFAAPDGQTSGARILAFPSLCRGGIHYSEWLRSVGTGEGTTEMFALGEKMGSRLLRLLSGHERAAISRIEVETTDADGRGPLFRSDVRQWLYRVIRIAVEPVAQDGRSLVESYLAGAVRLAPAACREGAGASLRVGADMIPSISALTGSYEAAEAATEEVGVSVIVSGPEADRPKILIEVPPTMLPSRRNRFGHATEWPRLQRSSGRPLPRIVEPAAIALPNDKKLSDAELFRPGAHVSAQEGGEPRAPISWIIETRGWPREGLAKAVHMLALQTDSSGDILIFLCAADALSASAAREAFYGRVATAPSIRAAIAGANTPLVGFIGAGVIFHDNRTAAELSSLLVDERVATASCVIVQAKHGSRRWPPVTDGGALSVASGTKLGLSEYSDAVAHLWRSHYPVIAPTAQVWLARNACLKEWIEASNRELGGRFHICSSLVTASQLGRHSADDLPSFIPRAPENGVTRVQALFG